MAENGGKNGNDLEFQTPLGKAKVSGPGAIQLLLAAAIIASVFYGIASVSDTFTTYARNAEAHRAEMLQHLRDQFNREHAMRRQEHVEMLDRLADIRESTNYIFALHPVGQHAVEQRKVADKVKRKAKEALTEIDQEQEK